MFPPHSSNVRTVALVGLLLLACLHTLHVARSLFLPIVLALLLHFLLIPIVRSLRRIGLPEPAGAGLVMLAFSAAVAVGAYQLADPAGEWMEKAPAALRAMDKRLRPVKQSVEQVSQATSAIERMADTGESPQAGQPTPTVAVKADWRTPLLHWTGQLAAEIGATLVLLYFLLASGDMFVHKLARVIPDGNDRRRAAEIVSGIERQLSCFLFYSAVQNAGTAVLFGVGLWALGMPNPALWAAATIVLQFIPYIGTIAVVSITSLIAALTFDELWRMVLPGAMFVGLTWVKGMFVTPALLGQQLALNPVAVLVGLIVWGWIWGVPGTLLAVPLFAALKIVADHITSWKPLGEFLGR